MALAWFGGSSKDANVEELIAKKRYAKAIELLRAQFKQGSRDARMRLQLADVLILAGKGREAIPILIGLADEHAREGFAAKAIALLKKIEKIEPGRADVEKKLAGLIHKERERAGTTATVLLSQIPQPLPEIGMEEIGLEPLASAGTADAAAVPVPEPAMSEEDFSLELSEVAQEALEAQAAAPAAVATPAVASPLFSDFTESELLAVMHGMELVSFETGDIVITEGEPGDSLFIVATGTVKAFIRNPAGRQVLLREMSEGSFFGEISILSGKPRTATVTAATRCEMLELDRATLDGISQTHPNVWKVLQEFYRQRHGSKDEQLIRGMSSDAPRS
jgi:hypothetical protein